MNEMYKRYYFLEPDGTSVTHVTSKSDREAIRLYAQRFHVRPAFPLWVLLWR